MKKRLIAGNAIGLFFISAIVTLLFAMVIRSPWTPTIAFFPAGRLAVILLLLLLALIAALPRASVVFGCASATLSGATTARVAA